MANTLGLATNSYPLMMNLSIKPKYEFENQVCSYDSESQTSSGSATMGRSWSTYNSTTFGYLQSDSDSQEDD